jgi:serine/threonine protein phosphatase PrpC
MTGNWERRGWTVTTRRSPDTSSQVFASPTETGESQARPRHWRSHGISVVGKRRKINEDAFIERPDIGLWAVADGMGGHQAGDVASRAIVDALAALPANMDLEEAVTDVESALQRVNAELVHLAAQSPSGQIIGSTVVVLLVAGHQGACVWAGDSRLYRYRLGHLEQLTRDHSLAGELSFLDILGDEQPGPQEHCNIITRAVGADPVLVVDILRFDIMEGDVFLLCSDGLDKEARPAEIEEILRAGDCRERAESLIELAMERGARDNVTVIVVQSS